MIDFAIKYKEAINKITEDRSMQLRQYELARDEWELAEQLRDVLKVRHSHYDCGLLACC